MPITIKAAKAWMANGGKPRHRHSGLPLTARLAACVVDDSDTIRGVGLAETPKAQAFDDTVIEISRVCTDGAPNACSMLYGALRRAAVALGWQRVVTYTMADEHGSSLKAAGFRFVAEVRGRDWTTGNKRTRWLPGITQPREAIDRVRWEWP